ncbi:transposable element Tcb2 transposase [Trichonephila clavipes]|nr:transposable element Tcb2 transposase [Trichonephila clavipes]
MHDNSVKAQCPSTLAWCGSLKRGFQLRCRPSHQTMLQNHEARHHAVAIVLLHNMTLIYTGVQKTTSGCFYPRSNHWEVGRRLQCDKWGCRVRNCSQHRLRLWRQFQTTGTAIREFTSGRPRGTTPADDRYIVLQARRNRRQTAGEIARHTTQATGRSISRFTVARRLQGGGLFARRPVRCVPLTPAHRRRRSLWCREHRNWRDNEWGRVLFTDESRFSLSSDSHRILIWRERGSHNHPSNIIERDRRLAARTLPPVTIRELRLALQDEWAAMPQQLIDTLILSMGRRCETCLAVREIISPTKDRMFLAGHPSQGCFDLQSHCAPCYFFNQASFYPL